MSFGGGFGGFGQNNNQQQNTGFGGFGANTTTTNTGTGFGSTANTGGFGSTNTTGGGLFGGGSTGFGGSGGAFGSNTTGNAFGAAKPAFGGTPTSGGSMFGGGTTTTTSGFGGSGFGSSTGTTSSPFGGGTTGTGGLFGNQNKPAFGGTTTSNPFGSSTNTTSPFGSTGTGAFGAPTSTALTSTGVGESPGTGNVPFSAFVEKEPNSSTNQQNAFQSICFQQPYQKFSPEELRLTDYNQGRRFGNGSSQPGAFGQTNFGGGFGSTTTNTTGGFGNSSTSGGTNLFGGGGNTSTPFGGTQPASTGFGAGATTTGGSIFGAKPATGGLFGGQTSAQPSGSLFGNTGTTSGFGGTGTTGGFGAGASSNTGGSLFGSNSTANKPAFSFGTTQPAAATGTGFGASTTTGGFGSGSGGLFGNNNNNTANQPATGFGAQQPAASNPFGGFGSNTQQQTGATGGLFGNTQPKPAGGLFGNPPAATGTGGLFGNTTTTNTNPFGSTTNTQNTGSLFGNKPAASGTGLFGATNTQNSTGGGSLFSGFGNQNQNQQQQNTGSLFGGLNNNTQQKPTLFGTQPQQQTGGGLFGNSGTQQQQGGMFGSLNNNNQQQQQQQQPQNSIFGNSIFGGSQQSQQNPQSLTASIADNNAFGSASLFQDLASGPPNPGPIATPLSNSIKPKKAAAIPVYRLSSASNYRFTTPQKRGFGFSYSNYGTPGSVSSTSSTPGAFSGSLLGGGTFGRTLNKSMSTSSLRRSFSTEDSILAPGAFSASPSLRQFGSTGSVKKLTINRSIRQDLFSPPNGAPALPPASTPSGGVLKKRVSFDQNTTGSGAASPVKQTNGATPSAEELGYLRPRASVNGAKPNGTVTPPEMEQVNNNQQLAIVNEEEPVAPVITQPPALPVSQEDQPAGNYYMRPSKGEIENMNRQQRSKVSGFVVGRDGIGEIRFEVPVDLTSVPLDDIIDNIVQLTTRSATVYAISSKKPPMGKGLNVPSTISLANSWPRKSDRKTPSSEKSGARFKKHIERLKRVPDTTFVSYDKDTGVWTFKVEHFTTYGFPEDEDETDGEGMSEFGQSTLSAPPDTPTPKTRTPKSTHMDQSFASTSQITQTESDPDDTFEFRKKKLLPGAFDDQEMYVDDDMEHEQIEQDQDSFLDERSVGSQSEDGVEEPMDQDDVFPDDESVSIMDQEMAGSFPEAGNTAELREDSQDDDEDMDMVAETPGAIIRARLRAKNAGTPVKRQFAASNDWANTLKTTISPQKQDRAYLKSLVEEEGDQLRPLGEPTPKPRRVVSDGRGFANSIDMMHSLFADHKSPVKAAKATATSKGFQFPYAKRAKTSDYDTSNMNDKERAFHESMKPSWGPEGTLVYAAPPNAKPFGRSSRRAREKDGILTIQKQAIVSENRDVRFAKFSNEASADLLQRQKDITIVDDSGDVPFASLPEHFSFADFFDQANPRDPAAAHEKLVWQLASVLFDKLTIPVELEEVDRVEERLRMDNLSTFWQKLVDDACSKHIAMGKESEEKAIAALSGHRIPDACAHLLESRDFHLATLVALIGTKDSIKKDMREQLNEWQNSQMLSEFSQPIRTIYELLAGNVCVCDGFKGQPEDRMESFIISKRFGLDWRQAFGLRLWYGIMSGDTFQSAVRKFAEDIAQDRETSRPVAWYVEQKIPTLWHDEAIDEREDLLWGLLKLSTFTNSNIEDVLRPENSQLSPLDIRLSWQLSQALTANGAVRQTLDDEDKADRTTLTFAAQLTNEGSWLDAVFVLLHLSVDEIRAKCIQDHLAHHAGKIGSEDSQSFNTLTNKFKIPASWIWEAKALYMRSVDKNSRGEVECLIRAGAFNEAHRTFSKEVAPNAVVELDYDTLRTLLSGFHDRETTISEWHLGGEIYQDFLELLDSEKKGRPVDHALLARLLAGLPAVVEESRHPAFMERVAIETISGVVAKTVIALGKKGEKSEMHKVLRLPLTEDKYLKHTVELSLEYYRGVMANAR